jgi:hypothetical protein
MNGGAASASRLRLGGPDESSPQRRGSLPGTVAAEGSNSPVKRRGLGRTRAWRLLLGPPTGDPAKPWDESQIRRVKSG